MTNPWNNSHRFSILMLIEMVSIFSSLHMSFKRLFIFLPLIIGLLFNPISSYALYPSDPSSVADFMIGKSYLGPVQGLLGEVRSLVGEE